MGSNKVETHPGDVNGNEISYNDYKFKIDKKEKWRKLKKLFFGILSSLKSLQELLL